LTGEFIMDILDKLRTYANNNHIPIIDKEIEDILNLMLLLKKPELILEIGTAIAYSTISMAKIVGKDTEIVSIERDEELFSMARDNVLAEGLEKQINLKFGDAFDVLSALNRKFDFIFLDAAKGQYKYFFEYIFNLLPYGGILISDNVNFQGLVKGANYVEHKHRTMVNNLRDYIYLIKNHEELSTFFLPVKDGLAISIRRDEIEKT